MGYNRSGNTAWREPSRYANAPYNSTGGGGGGGPNLTLNRRKMLPASTEVYPDRDHMISGYSGHVPGEQFQYGRTWEITTHNPLRKGTPWPINLKDTAVDPDQYVPAEAPLDRKFRYDTYDQQMNYQNGTDGGIVAADYRPSSARDPLHVHTTKTNGDAVTAAATFGSSDHQPCSTLNRYPLMVEKPAWNNSIRAKVGQTIPQGGIAGIYEPHPPKNHTHRACQSCACGCRLRPKTAPSWVSLHRNDQAGMVPDTFKDPDLLETYSQRLRRRTEGTQVPTPPLRTLSPTIYRSKTDAFGPSVNHGGTMLSANYENPYQTWRSAPDPIATYQSFREPDQEKDRYTNDKRVRTTTWPLSVYRPRESMKSGYSGHVPREQFQFGKTWEITAYNPLRVGEEVLHYPTRVYNSLQ